MTIRYATNGMPDYGADQMYQACKNAGTLNKDYHNYLLLHGI